MLEAIREHAQGWIAKIILGFIALTFAVWGVNWYFEGGGTVKPAATVNGSEISQRDFLEALQQHKEALGAKAEANEGALRQQVMEQLLNSRLLILAARESGMQVSNAQVEGLLAALEPFQENGRFSQARFEVWLRGRGMSQAYFAELVRQDMMLKQVQFAYGEGATVPKNAVARLAGLLSQEREVQERVYDLKDYINEVRVEDSAVKTEYEANRQAYTSPAQVRVQYLVLSSEALGSQVQVDEQSARKYYDSNQARYQKPEQRRASHILIGVSAGTDAKARAAARSKAEGLLKEIRAKPDRFSELARQHSEDPLSAAQGGDLGTFGRGMMVKPFDDAVFGMKEGDIVGPIETDFGYHIIRLDGIVKGGGLAFEQVRGEIITELRKQQAQLRFAEAADRFSNLVYEQPDSLEPAAKEFGLKVQESGWLSRGKAEPAILGHPKLMDALFADDVLESRHNTEAVEVSPGVLVAARVLEHQPEGMRPLQEVAGEIRLKLAAKAGREKAVAAGQQALQAAKAGQPPDGMGAPMALSRMKPTDLTMESIQAVFRADAGKLPAYAGTESPEGFRIYRILRIGEKSQDPELLKQVRRDLQRVTAQEELRAFMDYTRSKAEIVTDRELLEKRND